MAPNTSGWSWQAGRASGSQRGKAVRLRGERASLLFELIRVIGALQQLQRTLPPGCIIAQQSTGQQHSCRAAIIHCTAFAAAAQEKLQGVTTSASTDIWHDQHTLYMLQHGTTPANITAAQRSRVTQRLANYKWADNKLYRCMTNGAVKQVPAPDDRLSLAKQMHERCGHFGTVVISARRTAALVLNSHWWHGLQADVSHVLSACKECSRVKATLC